MDMNHVVIMQDLRHILPAEIVGKYEQLVAAGEETEVIETYLEANVLPFLEDRWMIQEVASQQAV